MLERDCHQLLSVVTCEPCVRRPVSAGVVMKYVRLIKYSTLAVLLVFVVFKVTPVRIDRNENVMRHSLLLEA